MTCACVIVRWVVFEMVIKLLTQICLRWNNLFEADAVSHACSNLILVNDKLSYNAALLSLLHWLNLIFSLVSTNKNSKCSHSSEIKIIVKLNKAGVFLNFSFPCLFYLIECSISFMLLWIMAIKFITSFSAPRSICPYSVIYYAHA